MNGALSVFLAETGTETEIKRATKITLTYSDVDRGWRCRGTHDDRETDMAAREVRAMRADVGPPTSRQN